MPPESVSKRRPGASAVWAAPFRPFFLATGLYAVVIVGFWLGAWFGGWPLPEAITPMQWHSHEMLFGMVAAAIAGFLLTAMCNWTGAPLLSGRALMTLFGLWLAGRVAMWSAAWLPGWLVAAIDLSFLLAVAVYAWRVIAGAGNRRNLPIVGMVALLWLANFLFHLGVWENLPELARRAELGTILLIVLLMVVIGGRITPAFTRNWLNRHGGDAAAVRSWPSVETAAVVSTLAVLVLLVAGAPMAWTSVAAMLAAVANGVRLLGWVGWKTRSDPLVWILHVGYAWIPVGLLLLGLFPWLDTLTPSTWLHALGIGAMGTLILGVMTRVCLGHTGRPLELPRALVPAYWLVIVATLLRISAAMALLPYRPAVIAAGLAWMAAFIIFAIAYWPVVSQPRADGRPG